MIINDETRKRYQAQAEETKKRLLKDQPYREGFLFKWEGDQIISAHQVEATFYPTVKWWITDYPRWQWPHGKIIKESRRPLTEEEWNLLAPLKL